MLALPALLALAALTVRPAVRGDLGSVASLCVDCFVDLPFPALIYRPGAVDNWVMQLEERSSRPDCALLVAEASNQLVGCIEVGLLPPPPLGKAARPSEGDEPYVANVAVVPEARGGGVATALLGEADALCREWGFDRAFCKVARANIPARRLYDLRGWQVCYLAGSDLYLCKDMAPVGEAAPESSSDGAA